MNPRTDNDDELLEALGSMARDEEYGLPALAELEAIARGEASADTLDVGDDPGMAALLDALASAPSAVDRTADAALAAFARTDDDAGLPWDEFDAEAEDAEAEAAVQATDSPATSDATPDNVVQFPAWRRRAIVAVPLIAAAAAVLFFVLRPSIAPLPDYTAAVSGGQNVTRGETHEGVPVLGAGDQLKIVLTPFTALEGEVAAAGWVMPEKGDPRPWQPTIEISPDGAVRIAGTGAQLDLAPQGAAEEPVLLRVIVGRAAALPDDPNVIGTGGKGWQRFDVKVRLVR